MDHSDALAPCDAAGCAHIQCHHQCVRAGPAVDHTDDLVLSDDACKKDQQWITVTTLLYAMQRDVLTYSATTGACE